MRPSRQCKEEEALLPDDLVQELLSRATAVHKMFLAGLGRGLTPAAAAMRAGWSGPEADRMAEHYLTSDPVVTPLVGHIMRLRELASLDGEDPLTGPLPSVH